MFLMSFYMKKVLAVGTFMLLLILGALG